jgi:hypothetical protein
MWRGYFRLLWIGLFCWVAVLGARSASWRLVIVPFLALGALLITRGTLTRTYPEFGRQAAAALVTLVLCYNFYCSLPLLRSWFSSQFPQTFDAANRAKQEADLQAANALEPAALEARTALQEYLVRKEDIVGQNIKVQLDSLNAKRESGSFEPEDEKKEKEVLRQFQKLVKERSELQELISGRRNGPAQSSAPTPITHLIPQNTSATVNIQPLPVQSTMVIPSQTPESTPPTTTKSDYQLTPATPSNMTPDDYTFILKECHRIGDLIKCWGLMTNTTDAPRYTSLDDSSAVDDEGNTIFIGTFGAGFMFPGSGSFYGTQEKLLPGVPTKFMVTLDDPHRNVRTINLALRVSGGEPHRYDTLILKGVPVQ